MWTCSNVTPLSVLPRTFHSSPTPSVIWWLTSMYRPFYATSLVEMYHWAALEPCPSDITGPRELLNHTGGARSSDPVTLLIFLIAAR
ncbi:hypothetical protein J3458_016628 [Metarhizium acridum]|uniref:uncharacterized protein n=1 Tax=Metarhizium acridum TaxID=92637 RepID=UPI001C6B940B|nr:hypothetical protein J3458_016628 [Metarhizium acridum]